MTVFVVKQEHGKVQETDIMVRIQDGWAESGKKIIRKKEEIKENLVKIGKAEPIKEPEKGKKAVLKQTIRDLKYRHGAEINQLKTELKQSQDTIKALETTVSKLPKPSEEKPKRKIFGWLRRKNKIAQQEK